MSEDLTYYGALLVALHALTATAGTLHALLYKSDSRAAFGWIGIVLFFPYVGALLYVLFGINRVRRKAQRRGIFGIPWTEAGLVPPIRNREVLDHPIQHVGRSVTGQPLTDNNRVQPLINGEEAFPQMIEAIDNAERQVLLLSYIFDNDATGRQFVAALGAAVARGVNVHVLVDDIGRRYSLPSILRPLTKAGVDVRCFMPVRLLPPSLSLNLRNHRKLLIVDGATGFAGGMNIGDRQLVSHKHGASDLHFRFEGQVVQKLSVLFGEDWLRSNGRVLRFIDPPADFKGDCDCRVVPDGPDNRMDHLSLLIDGVISCAQKRIRIVTPYFLPHRKLIGSLQSAALRGVDVCIVVPSVNNWRVVQWALAHVLWELVNVGVRIVEQPPPFAHAKCILVDDEYALVGSTNLDPRSLRLNFELGIEVFAPAFNARLSAYVEELIEASTEITRENVASRGTLIRTRDALAALFSPYM